MLLDPNSGFAIVSVSVAEAVDMPADDSCARDLYAFADLSDALVALKLGLLWPLLSSSPGPAALTSPARDEDFLVVIFTVFSSNSLRLA